MCDEDDSDEILEYTGGSKLSDLTFVTTYDYYSSWRIKEVFSVAGYDLQPVYLGYKALRYRPCQRYWIVDKKTNQRIGSSNNGYSFEDLRYFWVDLVFLFTVKITTPPEIRTADGLLVRSFLSL